MSLLTLLGNVAAPEVIVDIASKVPSWAVIPISAGIVLLAVAIFYVLFKYVRGGVGQVALSLTPEFIEIVQKFVKDKPGLDAHDVLNMVKHLSKSAAGALSSPENKNFEDVKDEVIAYVKEASDKMGFNVPDSIIEKEAQAAFLLIKKFPFLLEQLKK